jgi:hypothetical protein
MQLRQLIDQHERQLFAESLAKARRSNGGGFREAPHSCLGKAHLAFGRLFALYDNRDDQLEKMLGGFIMHDLATLPQSFPRPDLNHLPADSVFEGSELWSLSTGVGRIAGMAAAAVAGLLQAKALLVYPIVKPFDRSLRYTRFDFVRVGDPVLNPFVQTNDGGEIWLQPMVLEGEALERYVRIGFGFIFGASGAEPTLRFDLPAIPAQGSVPFTSAAVSEPSPIVSTEAVRRDEHSNGATQH